MLIATFTSLGRVIVIGQPSTAFATLAPAVIRHAELNPDVPIFVPVHPRIATTISFPRSIGEPLGTGFIDAEAIGKTDGANAKTSAAVKGEYVIDFEQGDAFFTVQPTARSELLNLNVPFEGATIVFYFYPVENPLSALASLILQDKLPSGSNAGMAHGESAQRAEIGSPTGINPTTRAMAAADLPLPTKTGSAKNHFVSDQNGRTDPTAVAGIQKTDTLPPSHFLPATPARLDGFLRKLRMVHAAQLGPELDELSKALKVSVAVSTAESASDTSLAHPVNDSGLYQLVLLRAVREPVLDAVGFVVLMRNTSDQALVFDPRTFCARCGVARYTAQVIDAPAALKPRETLAAYFAIVGAGDGRPGFLQADNDWRISVALVSPRVAPGESLTAETRAASKAEASR